MPADDTKNADSYTSSEGDRYAKQGRPNSQPGRQHADFSPADNIGGTEQLKPQQPACDGMQFAQETDYFNVRPDKYNNWLVTDNQFNHDNSTPGEGAFGNRQFENHQTSGGGSGFGINEIPHGQGQAFSRAETIYIDNSKADRGEDS